MSILEVKNLSAGYNGKRILKDCSFGVEEGEVVVILGASGDGKSTLMKAIAGLIPHNKGGVYFDNDKIKDSSEQLVPGHPFIKLINQDFQLEDFHTVEENIRLRLLSYDENYQKDRIQTLLRLTKLTAYRDQKANDLSGGQKQRLAIARALADEPDFILLDEPFNQLDFQMKQSISKHIINYIRANRIGAIMVTHSGLEAMEWADRIVHLSKGRIRRIATSENFYDDPQSLEEARFFGPVNKVLLDGGKQIYFRPEGFRLEKDDQHSIELNLTFKRQTKMGWYNIFEFRFQNRSVILYSTKDLSEFSKFFVKKLDFSD